ncbi:ABC transporter permease subunit [Microscilla marina]|uniref:ABC transporter, permease protein, putative n=1 Tax=Microscilla marina ATCC 23134 TaxID=313606 RepID=A1ZT27_MICM2|nr:ABC transporter permease subunit [Microscilla marina]EAY26417.1 ABC transporter, permease protein, putative [Microscilla marina ATCC 23134]
MKNSKIAYLWSKGGVVLFIMTTVLPMVLALGYALCYSAGWVGILSEGFTLRFWQKMLPNVEMWQSLGYTLYVTLASLLPATVVALLLATYFRRAIVGGKLHYLIYFPLAIPAIVAAFFVMQLFAKTGLLSRIVYQTGLIDQLVQFPDLINDQYSVGILCAHWLLATPFLTVMFLGMYDGERLDDLQQVATTLGATRTQAYLQVIIPALLRKGYPTVVLYGIFIFGAYEVPLLLGRQSPEMISVLATRKIKDQYDLLQLPEGYVLAVIYSLLMMMSVLWLLRKQKKRL